MTESDEWKLPPEPMRFEPDFYCDSCHRGKADTVLIGKAEPETRFMFLCLDCLRKATKKIKKGKAKRDAEIIDAVDRLIVVSDDVLGHASVAALIVEGTDLKTEVQILSSGKILRVGAELLLSITNGGIEKCRVATIFKTPMQSPKLTYVMVKR